MRRLVAGAVFKYVCVCIFLKKREQGKGGGEARFHVVRGRKDGTGLGRGCDPTGEA